MRRFSRRLRWVGAVFLCASVAAAGERPSFRPCGTAFVVSSNGYLVTCAHVVEDAERVVVAVGDEAHRAVVLCMDEASDLALLRSEAEGLASLPLGDSSSVEVGQEVRAFGFPLSGLLGSSLKATRGTLSGVVTKGSQKRLQTDAPVAPGNSGGPLVNERGELIGVLSSRLAIVYNVGFAVPADYLKLLLRQKGIQFATKTAGGKLDALVATIRTLLLTLSDHPLPKA